MRPLRTSLLPLRYGTDYVCVPASQLQVGDVIGGFDDQYLLVARCFPAGSVNAQGRQVARFHTIPLCRSAEDAWIAEGDDRTQFMRICNAAWLAELHGATT